MFAGGCLVTGTAPAVLLAHVAKALAGHVAELRRDGRAVPPELLVIAEWAITSARGRQEPTTFAADDAWTHAARVPVLLLDFGEVARELSVSKRTVERLVAAGDLPVVGLGGARRVRRVDLDAYVASLGPARWTARTEVKGNTA